MSRSMEETGVAGPESVARDEGGEGVRGREVK